MSEYTRTNVFSSIPIVASELIHNGIKRCVMQHEDVEPYLIPLYSRGLVRFLQCPSCLCLYILEERRRPSRL